MSLGCIVDYYGALRWVNENADKIDRLQNLEAVYAFCCRKFTALDMAVVAQRSDVIKTLLRRGASTANLEFMMSHAGGDLDFMEVMSWCYDKGSKPGNFAMEKAIRDKNSSLVRSLFEHGADPQSADIRGQSVFDFAVSSGDLEIIGVFLDRGARITDSSLFFALRSENRRELFRYLLRTGAKVNARNRSGETILIRVCRSQKKEERYALATLLLDHGADVNAALEEGYTSLIYASAAGYQDVVNLLLERGADWRMRDQAGRTALDFAVLKGNTSIISLLQTAMQ